MSEEKQNLQRQADRARPRRKNSVLSYLVILFAAAFVLLLMSYFMQQRSNEETIDGLKQTVSAVQSAQEVYDENTALREQLEELERQIEEQTQLQQAQQEAIAGLERENALLQGEKESLVYASEATAQAMDWFWQINEAYVRGRNSLARELIESIHAAGLVKYLPTESFTDNERFSPYERYQEIYNALY